MTINWDKPLETTDGAEVVAVFRESDACRIVVFERKDGSHGSANIDLAGFVFGRRMHPDDKPFIRNTPPPRPVRWIIWYDNSRGNLITQICNTEEYAVGVIQDGLAVHVQKVEYDGPEGFSDGMLLNGEPLGPERPVVLGDGDRLEGPGRVAASALPSVQEDDHD